LKSRDSGSLLRFWKVRGRIGMLESRGECFKGGVESFAQSSSGLEGPGFVGQLRN